jgi:hypothetical protein
MRYETHIKLGVHILEAELSLWSAPKLQKQKKKKYEHPEGATVSLHYSQSNETVKCGHESRGIIVLAGTNGTLLVTVTVSTGSRCKNCCVGESEQ